MLRLLPATQKNPLVHDLFILLESILQAPGPQR
jgi:hypothetical protein